MKSKNLDDKKPEWIALIVFAVCFLAISVFHEPWFDEAQSWEIAKGATLKEILFVLPHYEGHPPLWHLILAVPAKLGVSFELGLKTVGAVISVASAVVLLFFSKLPRPVRLCLPFTYFFFYQNGVITRPYGLMILVMLLLGMNLGERKEHPWRILLLLGILCLCSSYGIVLAGGIAICIVIEILREKGVRAAVRELFRDPRTLSLLVLLALAVILILEILPRQDTYYAAYRNQNPFVLCLVCALFTFPAECFLTSASWFSIDRTLLQSSIIEPIELIILCAVGAVLWLLIICSASKRSLKLLLIPYLLLAFFSARIYFSGHHLGIVFAFFLFWAEYISREDDWFEIGKGLLRRIAAKDSDKKLLIKTCAFIGIACLAVPVVWTAAASVHEIQYEYYYGNAAAEFLKNNDLDTLTILGSWHKDGSLVPFSEGNENYVNTVMVGSAVSVNAYFDHNIFFNLNHADPDQGFVFHRRPTLAESEADKEMWRTYGPPDVIIGKPDLKMVYGNALGYDDYKLVALIKEKLIWKTRLVPEVLPVFLRNDLLEEYHLEALDGIEYASVNGIQITEEMKERYYNGEPMEEILKPYLDVILGEQD